MNRRELLALMGSTTAAGLLGLPGSSLAQGQKEMVTVVKIAGIPWFNAVEKGIKYGLPERYAWYCAFGLLVGLIYLYWQILRLLSYVRR